MAEDPRFLSFRVIKDVIFRGRSLGKVRAHLSGFSGTLVRGVLKNFRFFVRFLKPYLSKKTDKDALIVLSMGLYQMFFMGVPPYASVNESVKLVERLGKGYLKGFINGVLRRISRDVDSLKKEFEELRSNSPYGPFDDVFGRKIKELLGDEGFRRFFIESLGDVPLTLSVNTMKVSVEDLVEFLSSKSIRCERTRFSRFGVRVFGVHSPTSLPGFREGFFFVQDEASQLASLLLSPGSGERVLDVGAFPGGKTAFFQIASNGGLEIWAVDSDPGRKAAFEANIRRLGLKGIKGLVMDFRAFNPKLPYHRGFLDAPCSSLGIFARRPDVLYTKRIEDIPRYAELQVQLLETLVRSVRRGGTVVYSVCTGIPEETLDVVSHLERKGVVERVDPSSIVPELLPFVRDGFFVSIPPEGYYMDLMFSCVFRKV